MKKKSSAAPVKPYWDMTAVELAAATKQFDKPIRFAATRPLSPAMRARDARARSGPAGSVRVASQPARSGSTSASSTAGEPHQCVVRLDDELWARVTEYARRHKTSVPKMIDRGLRGLLAFAG